ncbi:MAG: hypothetical protein QXH37_05925 [Candidatus Bathyarchaeia archaeon]
MTRKESVTEELLRLRKSLWKTRGRKSRATGAVFLALSGIFLALAYYTRYVVFETLSIVCLPLGIIFVFLSVESYVKLTVANEALISALLPLSRLLEHLGIQGKAVYFPKQTDDENSVLFILKGDDVALLNYAKITESDNIAISKEGVIFPSLGTNLVQLYQNELGDLRNFNLEYLLEWLPRVLVDGLQIAEKAQMLLEGELLHVKFIEPVFRHVCLHREVNILCKTIGCPLCSSIADAIARNTNRIIFFLQCSYDSKSHIVHATFRLGPDIKSLRKETFQGESVHENP